MREPLVNHYDALESQRGADPEQLRAAYLRLMRHNHPDLRPGDPAAAETARRVNQAWAVLKDAEQRAAYDRLLASSVSPPERIQRANRVTAPGYISAVPPQVVRQPAYSPVGEAYRRDFHSACLRVAGAVFAVGLLLLTAVG
ncbi:MAG: J domain-containing protein [Actinomycetota bacterium]|jgi:curved DNA-binding protein CbpA|nr:J domain-containing protein [Euzebyaceae bacterium]MDQ3452605.1 J domain-containing protein [Actinomycetota bacterium]